MTKMTKLGRTAILDFHNGVTAKGHTLIADSRTIAALVRNGWAVYPPHVAAAGARVAYVTRAGLIAAGVDMDRLHAKALTEWTVRDDDPRDDAVRAEAVRFNMRGGRGDARLWAAGIVRNAAHAEALDEDAQRSQCGCTRNPLGHSRADHPMSAEERDAHSSAYWEGATAGLPREPAF